MEENPSSALQLEPNQITEELPTMSTGLPPSQAAAQRSKEDYVRSVEQSEQASQLRLSGQLDVVTAAAAEQQLRTEPLRSEDSSHTSTQQLPHLSLSGLAHSEGRPVQESPFNDNYHMEFFPSQDHTFKGKVVMHHPIQTCNAEPVSENFFLAEHSQAESLKKDQEAECQSSSKRYEEEDGTEKNQMNMLKEGHEPDASDDLARDATHGPQLTKMPMAGVHGNATEEFMVGGLITSVLPLAQRAEIDTAAPFESVKAAVSLFGERMDWKAQQRTPQPQVSSVENEVNNKGHEDFACCKEQVALTQASTAGVLLELKKIKRQIEKSASSGYIVGVLFHEDTGAPDPSKTMRAVTGEHATTDLQTMWKEIESLKEKLLSAKGAEEIAGKGLQEAHIGLDAALKRVDELAGEQASLDEALAAAHLTLADAEEQVAMLRSGQKIDLPESEHGDSMEKKNEEIKGLELKLEEANTLIMKQREELVATTKTESYAVAVATEKRRELEKAKLQLDQAKAKELSMVGKVARILEESAELKGKLETALQFIATRAARMAMLETEREQILSVLDSTHREEQAACATLASLQGELQKVKEALVSAQAGEARALQAKETLPGAIKEAAFEADEAKAGAEASREEVRKARQGIEQAKAATSTAMSRHQAAQKEVEAARASEAMALAELKALTESAARGGDMEAEWEGVMGVTVPLEEYSALKRATVEAEGLADNKVAEAVAQVEEAKTSQVKAQSKLDDALKEVEEGKDELLKAQKQADDAQEAKLIAEGELRKWRAEHDPRRKSAALDLKGAASQVLSSITIEEETVKALAQDTNTPPMVQGRKVSGRDSLAHVMSLELPAAREGHDRAPPAEGGKKQDKLKRNIVRRLVSLVVVKKKTSQS